VRLRNTIFGIIGATIVLAGIGVTAVPALAGGTGPGPSPIGVDLGISVKMPTYGPVMPSDTNVYGNVMPVQANPSLTSGRLEASVSNVNGISMPGMMTWSATKHDGVVMITAKLPARDTHVAWYLTVGTTSSINETWGTAHSDKKGCTTVSFKIKPGTSLIYLFVQAHDPNQPLPSAGSSGAHMG
jgi:hypothetical protein